MAGSARCRRHNRFVERRLTVPHPPARAPVLDSCCHIISSIFLYFTADTYSSSSKPPACVLPVVIIADSALRRFRSSSNPRPIACSFIGICLLPLGSACGGSVDRGGVDRREGVRAKAWCELKLIVHHGARHVESEIGVVGRSWREADAAVAGER